MTATLDLSVITATYRRPKQLALCLAQFRRQSLGNLRVEHVVVSDGPDPFARSLAEVAGAVCVELEQHRGQWGAAAKDVGIEHARGEYVCFWDDDNQYEPHAAAVLYAAAVGVDVGVVQCRHHQRQQPGCVVLPRQWNGVPRYGDIDTMNVCVRRELARTEPWEDGNPHSGSDYRWIQRLQVRGATMRFVPVVIGDHL